MIASKLTSFAQPCLRQASRKFSNTFSKPPRIQDIQPKPKEIPRPTTSTPSPIIKIPIPPKPAPQETPMPMPKPPLEPKPRPPQHRPAPTPTPIAWSTFTGGPGYPITTKEIPLPPPPSQPLIINLRSLHETLYIKELAEEERQLPTNMLGDMSQVNLGETVVDGEDELGDCSKVDSKCCNEEYRAWVVRRNERRREILANLDFGRLWNL